MGNDVSKVKKLNLRVIEDKNTAQILLDTAELSDYYLEECHDNKANSLARKSLTYRSNTVPLREFNYATSFLEGVYDFLPSRLLMDIGDVNIIQLMPSADGGMPHTRPDNIICYPDFSQLFSRTTLIHELWHIHQRNYKDLWAQTFKRMGWTLWGGKLPDKLEGARRYNPDTIDAPLWIFDDKWVPIPVFKDITHPKVGEVEIWFYNPAKNYHSQQVPPEIANYYPGLSASAYEHPHELAAYILSEPDRYQNSMALKHLVESLGHTAIQNVSTK
jgi:hypothetical protein